MGWEMCIRDGHVDAPVLGPAFGDLKPVADSSTADGRAKNRRIDVVNAALRGKAIGGMPVDGSAPAAAPVCD